MSDFNYDKWENAGYEGADIIIIAMLESIDATLKAILARGKKPEPVVDLDGAHGDPLVKFNPRDWIGDDQKGKRMSECPPEFLDLLASAYDYFSTKPENDAKKQGYARKDAALCRAWAARLRLGWTAPVGKDEPRW